MKIKTGLTALIIILIFSGCSVYTFNPKGKSEIESINVEKFDNKTQEFGLEDRMTDQIIEAFIADGTMNIVAPGNSDAVLIGTLIGYERKPYNPDENDQVTDYAVRMTFTIKLVNPVDGIEIWKQNISQLGIYSVETETEEFGQQRAIALLIDEIINKTTKSW